MLLFFFTESYLLTNYNLKFTESLSREAARRRCSLGNYAESVR